jgi:serine protease AprX
MYNRILVSIIFLIFLIGSSAGDLNFQFKISPGLSKIMKDKTVNESVTIWIYFEDKGPALDQRLRTIEEGLNDKARQRRMRNKPLEDMVDAYDLPVYRAYVMKIGEYVDHIRHKSRWLNAISVEASISNIKLIASHPFVKKLDLVYSLKAPTPISVSEAVIPESFAKPAYNLDYGSSLDQNNQIGVPALHDLDLNGSGVMIAMLDAGFNNLTHEALSHLDIVATWDFVNGDSIVWDEPGQQGTGNHGTYTLSALAGFKEGKLIGPAYGASFLLAKTENTVEERHIEEDNWVAGAEWADSYGADIISSSLGYRDGFSSGEPNYTWQDMDGNTTIVTIGADIAASRGILVVNSAGNEGPSSESVPNTIVAPSDGDSVLAVGSVTASGVRSSFSSMGPTADGRIKPDVMARGSNTWCASSFNPTGYVSVSGTSLSCPLVAGAAALVLQANPSLTNMQIIEALINTSSHSSNPDNFYGWGIINASEAVSFFSGTDGDDDGNNIEIKDFELFANYPNPFNASTTVRYRIANGAVVNLSVFNIGGEKVKELTDAYHNPGEYQLVWNASNVATGLYYIILRTNNANLMQKALLIK